MVLSEAILARWRRLVLRAAWVIVRMVSIDLLAAMRTQHIPPDTKKAVSQEQLQCRHPLEEQKRYANQHGSGIFCKLCKIRIQWTAHPSTSLFPRTSRSPFYKAKAKAAAPDAQDRLDEPAAPPPKAPSRMHTTKAPPPMPSAKVSDVLKRPPPRRQQDDDWAWNHPWQAWWSQSSWQEDAPNHTSQSSTWQPEEQSEEQVDYQAEGPQHDALNQDELDRLWWSSVGDAAEFPDTNPGDEDDDLQ